MRRIFCSALLTIATIVSFLIGCQQDSEIKQKAALLERGSEFAQLYRGEYSRGKVDVIASSDGSIKGAYSHNGKRKVFTLQREGAGQKSDLASGQYEVLYLKDLLVLNNLSDGKHHILTVQDDKTKELLTKLPPSYLKNAVFIDGFGLAMATTGNKKEIGCTVAGGPGASQCSNNCCSVTCSSGYNAVCNYSCLCQKK